jgi:prepilin-type N-terminal cleavage/methylation domain-containing protein
MKGMRNQKGFTLVELAIVLVIIGIILGGVLQGREMINNARIKRVVTQEKEITAAVLSYQDRYNMLPGDDNAAVARGWAGVVNGNANGVITNTLAQATNCGAGEGCQLWAHLRGAGFIPGANPVAGNPRNTYSGLIGIGNFAMGTPAVTANWMVFTNIPAEAALAIDTQNDDGSWQTGNIVGSAAFVAPNVVTLAFRVN